MQRTNKRMSEITSDVQKKTRIQVNEIFKRFSSIYMERFDSRFDVPEDEKISCASTRKMLRNEKIVKKVNDCKKEWINSDLKYYSEEEVAKALDRAKHEYAWPPKLSEFLRLCENSLEYDKAEKAYQAVCSRPVKELDIVSRVTVQEVGQFELHTMSADRMKPIFLKKYVEVCIRKRKGEDLEKCLKPDPEEKVKKPASKVDNREFLKKSRMDWGV